MSDFTHGFWSLYVAGLTVISIVGCALLLTMQSRGRVPGKEVETTGHQWDGDLAEYNNPLPRWWMGLFWITIFFSVGYLALYPGLGAFDGYLRWSSSGEYRQEMAEADAQFGAAYRKYASMDIEAIALDTEGRTTGERLFITYCSQCHGSDARGGKGFPNLTDGDWLYGGDAQTILASILDGRKGAMPALGTALGEAGVIEIAHYVLSLSNAPHDSKLAAAGKPRFALCVGCHGADGTGNRQLGAPNLADAVWLYGGSVATIAETVSKGRQNAMPAHRDFLGDEKSRLLAAYVYSISRPATVLGTK